MLKIIEEKPLEAVLQNQTVTAGSIESAEGAGGKDLINSVKNDFTAQLKKLRALVNTAIEKCLILLSFTC